MALETAAITIDGRAYRVRKGENLLAACLGLGFDLPYFCWHPALGAVGACRQCAVKQFKDADNSTGRLVMACMTPAEDGTLLSIEDDEAHRFRASVVEWLMVNHPHDCPVCEEGGECHLQDMTHLTGHTYRSYRFRKRTHRNQDLGPFLNHEMNRCIACYRCVRFYRDHAGGRDLHALAAHDHVYFGRHESGTLDSPFAGNLAEVCPTGVFTEKPFSRHYVRKWDLAGAPSVCPHCSLGCNVWPNAREGRLRRVLNRYNHPVNGYFICDRGRYGPHFVNAPDRIHAPKGAAEAEAAVRRAAERLRGRRVIGIGSPRASVEANYALRRLVGAENFHAPWDAGTHALMTALRDLVVAGPVPIRSLAQAAEADAVLVLGEDVTNTAPRLALALRQAVRSAAYAKARTMGVADWNDTAVRDAAGGVQSQVIVAAPYATPLDDIATGTVRAAPDDLARLGFAVAHALDDDAPDMAGLASDARASARRIAAALSDAKRPLVVAGLGCANAALLDAAARIARALAKAGRDAGLILAGRAANDLGLVLLDPKPLDAVARAEVVVVLECAPRSVPADARIVLDHVPTAATAASDIVLPAAPFTETDGTFVSAEGRAQRFCKLMPPEGSVRESWRWLRDIGQRLGRPGMGWATFDDVTASCAAEIPALARIVAAAPSAAFRVAGERIPREPHRASGRTALHADRTVHDPAPPTDPNSPLSFTMEGWHGEPPSALAAFAWAPRWNSVQALNKFQDEVGGPWRGGDPGVRLFDGAARGVPTGPGVPPAFVPSHETLLVLPRWDAFASDPLAMRSGPIAARAPGPCIALHPEDAEALGLAAGGRAAMAFEDGTRLAAPVALDASLAWGVATFLVRGACPAGLPGRARLVRYGEG